MARRIDPSRPRPTDPANPLDQFLPEAPRLPNGDGRAFLGLVKLILIALVLCALAFVVLVPQR